LVNFRKSLGLWSADRYDETLFKTRKELAGACWTLSLFLPEGRKFFKYFPHIAKIVPLSLLDAVNEGEGACPNGPNSAFSQFGWLNIFPWS
jgi:hypothetical protein